MPVLLGAWFRRNRHIGELWLTRSVDMNIRSRPPMLSKLEVDKISADLQACPIISSIKCLRL